jgi:hypothetical protein
MNERDLIKALFEQLINAPLKSYPLLRGLPDAPADHGVYVIYGPRGKVLYVGRTSSAWIISAGGLRRRLSTHRPKYPGSTFRYVVIKRPRHRALLEAYATGCLCPKNLGTGERKS